MSEKIILLIGWLLFSGLVCLRANTAATPEAVFLDSLIEVIQRYSEKTSALPTKWEDLFPRKSDLGLIDSALSPRSITDVYSFVGPAQQALFPDGDLILVRASDAPWPASWNNSTRLGNYSDRDLTPEQKAEIEAAKGGRRNIRYIIYRDKQGKIRSEWRYADQLSVTLANSGVTIPKPIYYGDARVAAPAVSGTNQPKEQPSNSPVAQVVPTKTASGKKSWIPWVVSLGVLAGLTWLFTKMYQK